MKPAVESVHSPQSRQDFLLLFLFVSASERVQQRSAQLTLVLPEDPGAHELEEAAGVKPRPVHRDGVLRRGGGRVRARQACTESEAEWEDSTYAVVDQGLPGVLQLFHEPGGTGSCFVKLSLLCSIKHSYSSGLSQAFYQYKSGHVGLVLRLCLHGTFCHKIIYL